MNYKIRVKLFKEISGIRERPLISYITSFRQNASASIASDVIPEFLKQLQSLPKDNPNIDLLVISYGGDPTVSYRIITILRERYKKIGVLLPFAAYSAATLISLGADEILMHPFSNLGPVDPQLSYKKNNDENINFGSEDLRKFIEFVRQDVGLTDQEQMQKSFEMVCSEVGAIPIGIAKRSSQLALSMGEKLLSTHLSDNNKAKTITETLNKSFYHHGYPLGRTEALKIGLSVAKPPKNLEDLLWQVYLSYEEEMKLNEPFVPFQVILNDPKTSDLLAPTKQIQIPNNLPEDLRTQVYKQVLQNIEIKEIPPIDYELFQAALESEFCKSEFRTSGKIFANKLPDNNIALNIIPTFSGWKNEK